jgi:hypothetical protein
MTKVREAIVAEKDWPTRRRFGWKDCRSLHCASLRSG